MVEFHDRSMHSLTFGAILSNISNVLCVLSLWALLRHFSADRQHSIVIRIFAVLPILTSMIANTWFGMLGNNAIWPSINDIYPFIDAHCVVGMRFMNIIVIVDMYCVSVFILTRTYHFFRQVPSLKMSTCVYTALVSMLTIFAAAYCAFIIFSSALTFQVMIFQNRSTKQCELAIYTDQHGPNVFAYLTVSQSFCQFAILIVCCKKLVNFMQYLTAQKTGKPLSQHFSGYTVVDMNVNVIRRFLALSIVFILSYWCCFAVIQYIGWSFFPLAIMIKVMAITSSFAVFEKGHSHMIIRRNVKELKEGTSTKKRHRIKYQKVSQPTNIRDTTAIEMGEEIEEQRQPMMAGIVPFVSNHERSISVTCTHSTLQSVFEEEDEEEDETDKFVQIQWHCDYVYVEQCQVIYETLMGIFVSSTYAQLIAEYATTQYLPCAQCEAMFDGIECRYDLDFRNGATAMLDRNNEIRYYLNMEPESLTQCDNDNDHATRMEILCTDCAPRYKCPKCDIQTLTNTEMVDECIVCHAVFCELCSPDFIQYHEELDTDYLICDPCMEDDTITDPDITRLLQENRALRSCPSYERSQRSTDWQHWSFGNFTFSP